MDLQALIEELEEIVESASKVPLSSKCMIDREEVWNVVEQMRLHYPEELKQAQWVKKERDRIINEAKQEAASIIENANQQVVQMVNETEIIKIAKLKSEEIVKEADMEAVEIKHKAEVAAKAHYEETKERADQYKLSAQGYADSLLQTAEKAVNSARDTLFTAYSQINSSYQETETLLDKISSSRQVINSSKD